MMSESEMLNNSFSNFGLGVRKGEIFVKEVCSRYGQAGFSYKRL